ncbi:dihydrodipicolinate synthase family protein [Pontibacter sp. JH31]|uniref:Dihydrodipicolinate synthase family protein n=1 Tax=Pontibacter aquaedesilientis TaxID=2766980 RepID=A0ABR7XDM6_9BACT|nr:dihydrodipicolinate synthase family protein [Pontibacter aquaedesilientis]MBD1396398.1 dihydrodipicolinate synthase family protein [Pontibacter aquaedesilientis]
MNWHGVYPALTTKFQADGAIDYRTFMRNVDAQLEAEVEGIILGGTLGESSVLTTAEKQELTERTIAHVAGKVPVILNIAEGATHEAINRAREAEAMGAKGLMLLPPMRYAADHREVVAYFRAVADSTSLPIMIYNNPVDYKTQVTLAMFDELLVHENIQAVKESTRDVSNVTRMISRYSDRIKVLCGVDTLAMESLLMGAHGWVAGLVCAFPKETVAIYKLVQAGRIQEALEIYRWFLPLLELDIHPKLVQYIKLAEQQVGLGTEHMRPPRLPLIGEERERILAILDEGIRNRPTLPTLNENEHALR